MKKNNVTFLVDKKNNWSDFLKIYPYFNREKQYNFHSFYRKCGINDVELDEDISIKQQFNLLRIANNEAWPSHFYYEGKNIFSQFTLNRKWTR